jgi:hypothetical protein
VTNASDVQEENWKTQGIPLRDAGQISKVHAVVDKRAEQCAKASQWRLNLGNCTAVFMALKEQWSYAGEIFGQNFR